MAYRSQKLSSGEWVVKDSQGRQVANGFDNETEADQWVEGAERRDAKKAAMRRQAAR